MPQPHLNLTAQSSVVYGIGSVEKIDLIEIVVCVLPNMFKILPRLAIDDRGKVARSKGSRSGRIGMISLRPK